MNEELIAKITQLVIERLNDGINKSSVHSSTNQALTENELLDWQRNDLLKNAMHAGVSTQNNVPVGLTNQDIMNWQALNLSQSSASTNKKASDLIEFRNFC